MRGNGLFGVQTAQAVRRLICVAPLAFTTPPSPPFIETRVLHQSPFCTCSLVLTAIEIGSQLETRTGSKILITRPYSAQILNR